jgi:beta-glucuronidase
MIRTIPLRQFDFRLLYSTEGDFEYDNQQSEAQITQSVVVPHTWNTSVQRNYIGKASYTTVFEMEKVYYKTEIRFGAVNRFAEIYLNKTLVAKHNSGYTPFVVDVTSFVGLGSNTLEVICSNEYSEETLPYRSFFDWPNDGGILRDVVLINYESNFVKRCAVIPEIAEYLGNGRCKARIAAEIELDKKDNILIKAELLRLPERERVGYFFGYIDIFNGFELDDAMLWSPSSPHLYLLKIYVEGNEQEFRFGIRRVDTRGGSVFLNGEPIRLIGVQWMPGSSLANGMAERKEEIFFKLSRLKDLGCNFARFFFQQDDPVLDWCDEHGILVQEEIPFCRFPKSAGDVQYEVAKQQAEEMIFHHRNHPSIVFWGVGSALNGFSKKTLLYVEHMVRFFKSRDKIRLVNYVSDTMVPGLFLRTIFSRRPSATLSGDVCMWNDYSQKRFLMFSSGAALKRVVRLCRGRALVIAGFGLPDTATDNKKIIFYRKKLALYRKYRLAGWIYFCLNDYRTHEGDGIKGLERQKLCGALDIKDKERPSYFFIKKENEKEIIKG